MWAAALGNLPAIHLLRELSANLLGDACAVLSNSGHGSGSYGATAAHYAAANQKLLVLAYIGKHHPRLLIRACDLKLTPMHTAARVALEPSLLLLCQIISNNETVYEEGLEEELLRKDCLGDSVLDTMRIHMKASKLMIGLDIASKLYEKKKSLYLGSRMLGGIPNDSSCNEDMDAVANKDLDMLRMSEKEDSHLDNLQQQQQHNRLKNMTLSTVWKELGLLTAYSRTVKFLPLSLSKWLWTRGRSSLMTMPLAVVSAAICLSFVGVFYWPGHGPAVLANHPGAMWAWACSTIILLVSFATLQVRDPGYVRVEEHMKSAYRAIVLQGPPDETTVEEPVLPLASRSGIFGIDSMRAEHWCAFCEIGRPIGSASSPTVHCHTCRRCVLAHDHHCPWTGSCIAGSNLVVFRVFLASTLTTILAYINLYAKWRGPKCSKMMGQGRDELGYFGTAWCIINGPVLHSLLLIFVFAPLFIFAAAIVCKQISLWLKGETMSGRTRLDCKSRIRKVNLCGGGASGLIDSNIGRVRTNKEKTFTV